MSSSRQVVVCRRDTWAGSAEPAKNHSGGSVLRLNGTDAYGYLFFPKPFRQGMTIVSAVLRVYTQDTWPGTTQLDVQRVSGQWGLQRLNWNNKPGVVGSTVSVSQGSGVVNKEYAFDVTALMQTVANGADWYGFRIKTTATSLRKLRSSNDTHHTPVLEVEWSEAPQTPTDLSPAGGRAVSIAKPVVSARFKDLVGSTQLQAVQVQINPTNAWGAPAFDSGAVSATESELDLATTAYAGLSAGSSTFWRIRFQDGAGLWSPWSDPESFNRDTKGVLTITNPAASPNNFVDEWTPPISWTFTGETQKAWQVQILDPEDPTNILYDTGRVKGTDSSHNLPQRVIVDDESYTVRVRVWDAKDREHTPGDPIWQVAERDFTFREDVTVDPVGSIDVSQIQPTPYVEVLWTRATQPDKWLVYRDNKVIRELEGADPFLSGTSYKIVDRRATPRDSHTWKVKAVVNHKTSGNNPNDSLFIKPEGIWLFADFGDITAQLLIDGDDPGDWDVNEQGETWYPLNANRGIRVTAAVGGPTGTLRGLLNGIPEIGTTLREQRQAFYTIKRFPGRAVTLQMGTEAFDVICSNMVIGPVDEPNGRCAVKLDFTFADDLPFKVRY